MLDPVLRLICNKDKQFIKVIKNITGITPCNVDLYRLALQHKSVSATENNERLEFIGDAVLGSIIAVYLFKKFPDSDEGFLTQMRTKIVNNEQLNLFSVKLGLDKQISANLNKNELYFSVTAKSLEALIGAIYLDHGYKYVKKFIVQKLIDQFINLNELQTKIISFKSMLVEYAQKEKKNLQFKLVDEQIIDKEKKYLVHVIIDEVVLGEAEHYSKKKAEEIAAEIAYNKLFAK